MRRDQGIHLPYLLLTASLLLGSGCLSHPRVETVLHESPQATVLLKEFPDATQRASHPAAVDADLMRRVLTGVHVQEQKTMIESGLTGDARATPVFTLSEASFLAPLLSAALARATADEEVRFVLHSPMDHKRLDTAGALHAAGKTLNLSLTKFGFAPQKPPTLSRPTRSFDRAKRWNLTFRPESAVVNWSTEAQVSADGAEPNVLRISLDGLARYPEATAESGGAEGRSPDETEEELRRLRGTIEEQERRLDELERELKEK